MEITFLMNETSYRKFCVITQSAGDGNNSELCPLKISQHLSQLG